MFTPIGTLLNSLPRRSKIPEAMVAIFVRRAFGESIEAICSDLGENVIKKIKPTTFHHGILTVDCPNLLAAELSMRSGGLIREINKVLGKTIVKRLRFRAG